MDESANSTCVLPDGVDASEVRSQLDRILADPAFASAPQLSRLLRQLVESALGGNTRDVKEYALGVELFGRGADFDPKLDNIVRSHAHRLRGRLQAYFDGPGRGDPVEIVVPKGHYVARFQRRNRLPSVDVAPTGAQSPAAFAAATSASAEPLVSAERARRWRFRLLAGTVATAVVALLALALMQGGVGWRLNSTLGRFEIEPFGLTTDDAETQRFAKGLAESLERDFATNDIATVPFVPSDGVQDTKRNVDYTVRGTVERDGGQLVVTADVVDRSEARILWSITVRRNERDARQLQELFSVHVASVLKCVWRARRYAQGDASPELVAKFLRYCDNGIANRYPEQIELARSIRDAAPQYAISHAMFAGANAMKTLTEYERLTPAELERPRKLTYESATAALTIEANFGTPYWSMAIVHDPEHGLAEREQLLQKSLEVDPEYPYARNFYAMLLSSVGRRHEAANYYARYASDEPLYPGGRLHKARAALEENDMTTARQMFAQADALMLGLPVKGEWAFAEHWLGDPKLAVSLLDDNRRSQLMERGVWPCLESFLAARANGNQLTEADIEQACASGYHLPAEELFAYFGHVDAAFRVMESWPDEVFSRGPFLAPMRNLFTPRMRSVRADPRFMPLAARLGLVDYWIETDQWPDYCSSEKLPYDCREAAMASRAKLRN